MYTTNIVLKHSYDLVTKDDKSFQPFPKKLTSDPDIEARKLLEPKVPKVGPRGISDQHKKTNTREANKQANLCRNEPYTILTLSK